MRVVVMWNRVKKMKRRMLIHRISVSVELVVQLVHPLLLLQPQQPCLNVQVVEEGTVYQIYQACHPGIRHVPLPQDQGLFRDGQFVPILLVGLVLRLEKMVVLLLRVVVVVLLGRRGVMYC